MPLNRILSREKVLSVGTVLVVKVSKLTLSRFKHIKNLLAFIIEKFRSRESFRISLIQDLKDCKDSLIFLHISFSGLTCLGDKNPINSSRNALIQIQVYQKRTYASFSVLLYCFN
jgi:hypothetical protein